MKKKIIGNMYLHSCGKWAARVYGKMKYFGQKGGPKEAAELEVAKLRVQLSIAEDNRPVSPNQQSLRSLFALYLDAMKGETSEKNQQDKERCVKRFVEEHGDQTPESILPAAIMAHIKGIPSRSSGGGQRQVFAHLCAGFRWMRLNHKVTVNPMEGQKRKKVKIRCEEYVISAEEWQLMRVLLKGKWQQMADVLYFCGARPNEVVKGKAEEWQPQHQVLSKVKHKTDDIKIRDIVMSPTACDIINTQLQGRKEGYIWINKKGKPWCEQWLCELLQAAARKIGRTKPTDCYSLRHSFAVRKLEAGFSLEQVSKWMGNTVAVCEKHYAHTLERLRRTVHLMKD